jgi:hypothetical protein
MKKMICACVIILTGVLLMGFTQHSPIYRTTPVFNAPKTISGKQCVNRCLEQKTRCDQRCGSDHQQCLIRQKTLAHEAYIAYVNDMLIKNKKLTLTENDFMNDKACDASCECTQGYASCYVICGGAVTEHNVCIKNC